MTDHFASLRPNADQLKTAVEQPNQQQMEQDFAGLAFAFLRDRAPALVQYLVGFEVVDQDPAGTRAVGLFGFEVGDSFYQVPVFFLNSQIRGMDVLFIPKENKMVPLQPGWITRMLDNKTSIMGNGVAQDVIQNLEQPDFQFMAGPPYGNHKFGSSDEGRSAWAKMCTAVERSREEDPEFLRSMNGALGTINKVAAEEYAKSATSSRSLLKDYLTKVGGPDQTIAFLQAVHGDTSLLKAAYSLYDLESFADLPYDLPEVEKTAAKLTIVTEEDCCCPDTSEATRKTVLEYGYGFEDHRSEDELADVEDVEYLESFCNPIETGEHAIMMAGPTLMKMFVSTNVIPIGCGPDRPSLMAVPLDGTPGTLSADPGRLWSCDVEAAVDRNREALYSKATAVDEAVAGKDYLLVDSAGDCSTPFRVRTVVTAPGKHTQLSVCEAYKHCAIHRDDARTRTVGHNEPSAPRTLILVDRTGKVRQVEESLVVPIQSYKLYALPDIGKDRPYDFIEKTMRPASIVEIQESAIGAGYRDFRLHTDDDEHVTVTTDGQATGMVEATKQAAFGVLVIQAGLRPDDALAMLKESRENGSARRFIKLGQVTMPPAIMPSMGMDGGLGIPLDQFSVQQLPGQSVPPPMQEPLDPRFPHQGQMESQQGMGSPRVPGGVDPVAAQGAGIGQDQVFDSSIIESLAGVYDTSNVIDTYLPVLEDAMDRLGRILFLFYWKNEDFAARYGDQDLTGLEDQLRSVFKNFGDLVLKFRQKAIDAEAPVDAMGL